MKLKLIFINILIFIIILVLFEFFVFICSNINKQDLRSNYKLKLENSYDKLYLEKIKPEFRKPLISNSKKGSILILGCSFAYGHKLQEKDTFSYKLWKQTNRTVYNRAFDFYWGFHNAYYQFERDDFYDEVKDVKTIIYVYISDHISRAKGIYFSDLDDSHYEFLRYRLKKGQFKQYSLWSKYPILNLYILKLVRKCLYLMKMTPKNYKDMEFCEKFFLEMKDKAVKNWGEDIDFIILNYDNGSYELMKILKSDGFIVYNLSELTDINLFTIEYQIGKDDDHPNAKAWDIIVPEIVKKADL